ncbi:hypothetical protein DRF57_16095 [Chryseobacterium rhizosphaerae]|uniref:Uncharacterized protein n=1 Tax=Chryseobacterium rhizosphaerae TaxID=395937 RepID=A0ABX9IHN0_9FLAO|nr:hypothetical protein DRF57_16095 [Chryseobacterium rhizosphaerae]
MFSIPHGNPIGFHVIGLFLGLKDSLKKIKFYLKVSGIAFLFKRSLLGPAISILRVKLKKTICRIG